MAAHRIPAIVSSPFLHGLAEGFVLSVGEERASRAMPMRTYLDSGVPLAGSSDSPVAEFNPWLGISSAVRRISARGRELGPDEALTPREALASYTIGAAYATGRENWLGSISVGKLADLVVLDRDPLACPVEEIASIAPVATMAGGEWVAGGV